MTNLKICLSVYARISAKSFCHRFGKQDIPSKTLLTKKTTGLISTDNHGVSKNGHMEKLGKKNPCHIRRNGNTNAGVHA